METELPLQYMQKEKKQEHGFFWNDTVLSEVNYSNNQIASVKNWKKKDALVNVE
jgi:hypothetical protein